MIFVTHDLGVIADVADDVVVMYAGQIVEHSGGGRALRPARAIPTPRPCSIRSRSSRPGASRSHAIPGMVPRPDQLPPGCRFAPRCSYAQDGVPVGARAHACTGRRRSPARRER